MKQFGWCVQVNIKASALTELPEGILALLVLVMLIETYFNTTSGVEYCLRLTDPNSLTEGLLSLNSIQTPVEAEKLLC